MKKHIKQTFYLLKTIVDSIEKTINIDNVIDNLDGTYKIETCNTLWLTFGYTITIDDNDYVIADIMPNEWILVTGTVLPAVDQFEIYAPKYTHGTILAQNQELSLQLNSQSKFPMIYLHEITRERFNYDPESNLDRESECDLYFLIDCNIKDWITTDHDRYAIQPMRNLLHAFVDKLLNSGDIGDFDSTEVFDHANFGYYETNKGHVKQVFNDHTSGCQLRMNIPILRSLTCEDC